VWGNAAPSPASRKDAGCGPDDGAGHRGQDLGKRVVVEHPFPFASGDPFERRVDPGEQAADVVGHAGDLACGVVVVADQHLQFGRGFVASVDPARSSGQGVATTPPGSSVRQGPVRRTEPGDRGVPGWDDQK
jgi:hypothetical protein